jgi:uncharacterized membrane protein YhiD involved in acid resistance
VNPFSELQPLGGLDFRTALLSLLLAFGLTQAIAGTYVFTFRGLSYSRAVVQAMAMTSLVTCMVIQAAGNSIAAGLGIAGALTAIRFRTTMRDPRDLVFVFASLGVGIASGARAYSAAIAGALVFMAASLILHISNYGAHRQIDALLRFVAPAGKVIEEAIGAILRRHCRTFALVTLREAAQATALEYAYQISVRNEESRVQLVRALQAIEGIADVTLLAQEPTLDL